MALGLAGCASIGPAVIPRDRVDFITAVGDSWKEQTLLNLVRLRYGDTPSFLDISSVVSSYGIQGQVSAGGMASSNLTTAVPWSSFNFGASGLYQERPTISYTPLSGDKFTRSLLRPIPPAAIFQLVQAGYPIDGVLQVTVRSLNGVHNHSSIGGLPRRGDPQFYTLLAALRRLQTSGMVNLRMEKRGPEETGILLLASDRSAQVDQDLQFVSDTLRLKPDSNREIRLAFGAVQRSPNEIAVLSRSVVDILLELAAGIDVPGEHIAQGRTTASGRRPDAENPRERPLVRILSGPTAPADAFTAIRYRGTAYWIEDTDAPSKRAYTMLLLFFSLAETGITPQTPALTIPVN